MHFGLSVLHFYGTLDDLTVRHSWTYACKEIKNVTWINDSID
jgi:hypothetical protein